MSRYYKSIRQWILRELPYDLTDIALVEHLNELDVHGLLVVYHNWISRLIKPEPRQVLQSQAFKANPIVAKCAGDFALLVSDIEKGDDLKKYLSRDVLIGAQLPGSKRRKDLDLMLIEWGVHHLHISQELDPDGFVKRDGPLLFAVLKPGAAYLIDVMSHGDWTRKHVLQVLLDEWADAGIVHEIKGTPEQPVIGLAVNYTEKEHARLRKVGVNVLLDLGGRVVAPAGGASTAGTAIAATRAADNLLDAVDQFEAQFDRNFENFKDVLAKHGFLCPENPEFEFAILPDGFGMIETNTQQWIRLG